MKKIIKAAAFTGGALCIVKGLDNRLEVTHYNISSKKIPLSFNGFKIAHISDYHCDSVPGLISEIRNEEPDIIVSTGDLADDKGSFLPAVRLCEHLSDIAPVYAVTGNHDLWRGDYEKFEKETECAGVRTLHNERVLLKKGDSEISLSGIDDPFTLNSSKAADNIQSFLSKISNYDGYDILLFHRANLFECVNHNGFDLILSGHMHGGQVRFPKSNKGLVSPRSSWLGKSVFFPKYVGGHYKSPHTEMIVSRGIGNPMLIPRLFNRPELTVVTLRSENNISKEK
ncbi:MAG: metallophosphoesterase [Oscillospiraceae bacterium]|nr:metallophosphoesterase [Oscillospiraceae bacterium]